MDVALERELINMAKNVNKLLELALKAAREAYDEHKAEKQDPARTKPPRR